MEIRIRNIHQDIIYPRFYRYRKNQSDRNWIFSRMSVIKKEKQAEVAEKYERLFLSEGRDAANKWLNDLYLDIKNGA